MVPQSQWIRCHTQSLFLTYVSILKSFQLGEAAKSHKLAMSSSPDVKIYIHETVVKMNIHEVAIAVQRE